MFVAVYSMSIITRVLYGILFWSINDRFAIKSSSLSLSLILSIETLPRQNQDRLIAIHRGRAHKSVCAGCEHKRCVSDACERILREHAWTKLVDPWKWHAPTKILINPALSSQCHGRPGPGRAVLIEAYQFETYCLYPRYSGNIAQFYSSIYRGFALDNYGLARVRVCICVRVLERENIRIRTRALYTYARTHNGVSMCNKCVTLIHTVAIDGRMTSGG